MVRRIGLVASLALGAVLVWAHTDAAAQTSTTGSIRGKVTESSSGQALSGVTVVATSPVLQGTQAGITDARGGFFISSLPPGPYLLTFYFSDHTVRRSGVQISLGQVRIVNQKIDTSKSKGEVIVVRDRSPSIDPTSTNQGTRLTQDQLQNIPVPGRTFASALGAAAGSQGDSRGVAFSGSTSLENSYVIDGVNTTSLNFGQVGTPLINEFIEEIQVITGGYQAEYGRATGAVVNVITKQGSNEFHGTVFSTILPYQVNRTPVRDIKTSIDSTSDLDYQADFGFDLGGPIVKDRVWFYIGFAPQFSRTNVNRVIQRQTDCRMKMPDGSMSECNPTMYGDGTVDEDENGDIIFEEIARSKYKTSFARFQFVSKINFAIKPEHQGQMSITGAPITGEGLFGVSGPPEATRADFSGLNSDVAFKWTSKFNNNRTEVEFVAGWHRDKYDQDAIDNSLLDTPTTRVYFSNLSRYAAAGNEAPGVQSGCNDSAARGPDPYPFIENCPVFQYWLNSPGFIINNLEDRKSAQLKVTQRFDLGGSHLVRGGVDIQGNNTVDVRHLSGGAFYQLITDRDQVRVYRYVRPDAGAPDTCGFNTGDSGGPDFMDPRECTYLDKSTVHGNTLNWSAFLQDSWQVMPNFTLNAGLRYEEQRMRYAEGVRGTFDEFINETLHKNALRLRNMWAPRFGAIYDWTKEGRSKVYSSFGRFYESIPMALNDFSFSGDVLYGAFFNYDQCQGAAPSQDIAGQHPNPTNCPTTITQANNPPDEVYRGGTTLVTPGTRGQYMDEAILGVEYEVVEDLRLGLAFKTRRMGRVLEDVSIDSADTYIVGNPGYYPADEEDKLQSKINSLPEGDERDRLEAQLAGFQKLRRFDKPRRDYNAIELNVTKRFSRNFYLQTSYTYARAKGNYPGLLNDDTGSALPNISTQYDLIELLANRDGPLPQDRPHYFKLDGYYSFDMKRAGVVTLGLRLRALSGTPIDALGAHYLYGFGESYVLPRGTQGRTEFVSNTDIHVSYARNLAKGYKLSAFFDVINLFNAEQIASTDELYTFDNVNPVVGGTREDLIFAKQISATGGETSDPIGRNIAYGTPLGRYAPLYVRFGVRLSF